MKWGTQSMLLKVPILFECYAVSTGKKLPLNIPTDTEKHRARFESPTSSVWKMLAARTEQIMDNTCGNNTGIIKLLNQ
jgi:hypothetical protein